MLCLVYACTWYSLAEHLDSVTVLIASSLVTMAFLVFLVIIGYHTLLVVFSCTSVKSASVVKAYQSMAKAIGAPVLQSYQHQSLNEHKANIVPQYREPLLDVSYVYGSTN